MIQICEGADQLLYAAYSDLFKRGENSSPRGDETIEQLGWTALLDHPRRRLCENPVRDIRKGYAAAKVIWDVCAMEDIATLRFFNPNAKWYDVDGRAIGENYGSRFMPYLREALNLLETDHNTRRAWVPVWQPTDMLWEDFSLGAGRIQYPSRVGVSTPCCLGFHMLRRGHHLHMHVIMRSQSVGVMPYDIFLLTTIQELAANTLGLGLGMTYWTASSLHVYMKELDRRTHELDWWREHSATAPFKSMPPLPYTFDEAGTRWLPLLQDVVSSYSSFLVAEERTKDPDPVEKLLLDDARRAWEGNSRELSDGIMLQ